DEAIFVYKYGIQLNPSSSIGYSNLGNAFYELGEYNTAIPILVHAIKITPSFSDAHNNIGNCCVELKRFDEAITHYELASTSSSEAQVLECIYKKEDYDEFNKRLNLLSKSNRLNIRIAALSAFAAYQLKQENSYPFCTNPLDFISVGNLESYVANPGIFIRDLISEAETQNPLWEPQGKTTKSGFQTKEVIFQAGDNCATLEKIIWTEIEAYYAKFIARDDPFITSWPSKSKLSGWYVRLVQEGHQKPHIHPGGWLSGVAYLKTVGITNDNAGAIELSLHGYDLPIQDDTFPKTIHSPRVGDIILFPSSLFHRTIPFKENTDRCVIAFDLIPQLSDRL
ncbi:putative 2OG-Fe(II) oxygenase, partial [Rhodospirillaceae bacterium]|nr:putative 2OG-Fe(II) oxygenase [Rhodospirillaceae bacterium]